MSDTGLPFFVYGTLLPGEPNHDRFLRGRTYQERPAVLPGALLYEGPGYPYAVEGQGTVHGALVTAAPRAYAELLGLLDDLEEFLGPGHPRNLYERVAREAVPAPGVPDEPGPGDSGAREPDAGQPGAGQPGPGEPGPVRAWVYLAAGAVARSLRTGGTLVPGGDWLSRRRPPARRTP
ncbi:gamma-glutamylcyclotransferase [Streptomyces sp. NPDC006978]|uniref:gamma-glutamylcyclotransferase n=1 Tax=unclassified Streptomyces TaxID=2593676 RepID=UPI002AFE7818|nr:gamma-glutamylcyclotransferase [Streptomyces sp. S584]